MEHLNLSVHASVKAAGFDLRSLAVRYSQSCWAAWKSGKTNDLENPENPFVGGPGALLAMGINSVEGADGKEIRIHTRLQRRVDWIAEGEDLVRRVERMEYPTRLRVRQLSDNTLRKIGAAFGKNLMLAKAAAPGKDVVHQEYVDTFEENAANDPKHLLNNLVSATAVVDTVLSYIVTPGMTVKELVGIIRGILSETPETEKVRDLISAASRMSWIGRACQDGSWKESQDFGFLFELAQNTRKIDEYVVVPVLRYFLDDLVTNFGKS